MCTMCVRLAFWLFYPAALAGEIQSCRSGSVIEAEGPWIRIRMKYLRIHNTGEIYSNRYLYIKMSKGI
jgi:hypothetical protein